MQTFLDTMCDASNWHEIEVVDPRPANEVVNLNIVYWLAKDIGLVKMHWGGSTFQQGVEAG